MKDKSSGDKTRLDHMTHTSPHLTFHILIVCLRGDEGAQKKCLSAGSKPECRQSLSGWIPLLMTMFLPQTLAYLALRNKRTVVTNRSVSLQH